MYKGIEYTLTKNGAIVTKCKKQDKTFIEIPKFFNGSPVIGIGELAFFDDVCLEKIVLPNTIESIGSYAFYGCRQLKEVIFSENNKTVSVGEGAFSNCLSLNKIDTLTPLSLMHSYSFRNCLKLQEISIIGNIPHETFFYCASLKTVHWYNYDGNSNCLATENAFEGCKNIQRLYLYFDFVKFHREDLECLQKATIFCEETCDAANLIYDGYAVEILDYNLPF